MKHIIKLTGCVDTRDASDASGEYDGWISLDETRDEARWFAERTTGGSITIATVTGDGDLRHVETVR